MKIYRLNKSLFKRLSRLGYTICKTCQTPIKSDDIIVSMRGWKRGQSSIRHYSCAKRINLV
jgi:hypothetical protein